jgi:hypothetical protein
MMSLPTKCRSAGHNSLAAYLEGLLAEEPNPNAAIKAFDRAYEHPLASLKAQLNSNDKILTLAKSKKEHRALYQKHFMINKDFELMKNTIEHRGDVSLDLSFKEILTLRNQVHVSALGLYFKLYGSEKNRTQWGVKVVGWHPLKNNINSLTNGLLLSGLDSGWLEMSDWTDTDSVNGVALGAIQLTRKNINGIAVGGIATSVENLKGVSVGAMGTFTKNLQGVAVSNTNFVTAESTGVLLGGANGVRGHMQGLALSFALNDMASFDGMSGAFVVNVVKDGFAGVQLAGIFNVVGIGDRFQKSIVAGASIGLLNFGYNLHANNIKKTRYTQLGLFNYISLAEEKQTAVTQWGLINVVHGESGYSVMPFFNWHNLAKFFSWGDEKEGE